jgi:hypothetical protein
MSKRESSAHAAESSSPPGIVCVLLVDVIIDEAEVEIRCERMTMSIEFFDLHGLVARRKTERRHAGASLADCGTV